MAQGNQQADVPARQWSVNGRGMGMADLMRLVLAPVLQPIVEIHSGRIYGFEALMRGANDLGFASPVELLDHAFEEGLLVDLEILLHERAITMFAALSVVEGQLLFLNIDGRIIADHTRVVDALEAVLKRLGVPPTAICLELSERHQNTGMPGFDALLKRLSGLGIATALDDFGVGHSELRVLCDHRVDYVKIDRHFISEICVQPRRRLFVASLARFANALGIKVVAEGVETVEEFQACRDAGCNLVQGYLVGRPTHNISELQRDWSSVVQIRPPGWHGTNADEQLLRNQMQALPTVTYGADFEIISELFRQHPDQCYFPVVDPAGVPRGLIHERSVKDLIYSRYGRELVSNKSYRPSFDTFVSQVPSVEIDTPLDEILRLVAASPNSDGIVLTRALRYCGVMSSVALLKVLNERQVRSAQDRNPLTGLPGNIAIGDHMAAALRGADEAALFAHIDFDNFKPFNDYFGFADGDRAILLFARVMEENAGEPMRFAGHVGGDDFFCGFAGGDRALVEVRLKAMAERFRSEILGFYSPEDRLAGHIRARDRDGKMRVYPLIRASVAVVEVPAGPGDWSPDAVTRELALVKQMAKRAPSGLAWKVLGEGLHAN